MIWLRKEETNVSLERVGESSGMLLGRMLRCLLHGSLWLLADPNDRFFWMYGNPRDVASGFLSFSEGNAGKVVL